jgi:hypothetical protein
MAGLTSGFMSLYLHPEKFKTDSAKFVNTRWGASSHPPPSCTAEWPLLAPIIPTSPLQNLWRRVRCSYMQLTNIGWSWADNIDLGLDNSCYHIPSAKIHVFLLVIGRDHVKVWKFNCLLLSLHLLRKALSGGHYFRPLVWIMLCIQILPANSRRCLLGVRE